MSPTEFWLEFDSRMEQARNAEQAVVGGKAVSLSAVKEAQARARKLHRAKKAQEAAA